MGQLLVYSTCPDIKVAEKLASILVEKKLAACVNILPAMQSIYHWQGKLQNDREHLLLIKTDANRYSGLEKCIKDNHPYELPEIIAVDIKYGLPGYLGWVSECCEDRP